MSSQITITIPGLPPSENHALLRARNGRMFPSKEYRKWKVQVSKILVKQKIDKSTWYHADRVYYFPIFYKNGNVRKRDVSNLNKYADDELCKKIKIDDSHIKSGTEQKIECKEGEEKTIWRIVCI